MMILDHGNWKKEVGLERLYNIFSCCFERDAVMHCPFNIRNVFPLEAIII